MKQGISSLTHRCSLEVGRQSKRWIGDLFGGQFAHKLQAEDLFQAGFNCKQKC